ACGERNEAPAETRRGRSVCPLLGRVPLETRHRPLHAIAAPMPGSPSRNPRRPLFVTVLSLFLAVALLVATAVTVTNYIETGKTAVKVADDTFSMTINRINEQRVAFFTPAFLLTNVLRNAPSFQTADGSKDAIRQLIPPRLSASPQISAVYVGYDNGNFFHILSITESEKAFVEQLGGP